MPDSWLVRYEECLAGHLSQLARFQSFVGETTDTDALERIHLEIVDRDDEEEFILPEILETLRPFAIISSAPSIDRIASGAALNHKSELILILEINHAQVKDQLVAETLGINPTEKQILRWVKNQGGLIAEELFAAWDNLLSAPEIGWRSVPASHTAANPFCRFYLRFSVGVEG